MYWKTEYGKIEVMKKLLLVLSLFCLGTSLFALSDRYEKIMKAAKSAEEKGNYVYALNYYYEAMEEEPFLGRDAYDCFNSLASKIRTGNPTGKELDAFDMNDLWCGIIAGYNQYYSKNNPYIYIFDELVCSSLDYNTKTSNWIITYKTIRHPRYQAVYDSLAEGFKNTNYKEWNNVDSDWLHSSELVKELDFDIDIIDKDGKIISSALTENKKAFFKDVNRSNTKTLNAKKITLSIKNPDGINAILQTPYKKNKNRMDVIKIFDTLTTELYDEINDNSAEDLYPFYYLNDFIYEDLFNFVMEDYYSWQEKNLKDEEKNSANYPYVFCNLLSQKFNLKPCYSVNGSTNVYNWGVNDKVTVDCNYDVSGFRLPVDSEIEVHPKVGRKSSVDRKAIVVRSDVEKRRVINAERKAKAEEELKKQKELEKQLKLEQERQAAEEAARLAAENAVFDELMQQEKNNLEEERLRLEEEQARLDAKREAKAMAAELRREKNKLLAKKIKSIADDSIRNTIFVRGYLDNPFDGFNPGVGIYGSAGYHFLFGFADIEFPAVDKFIEAGYPFKDFRYSYLDAVFGIGISYPVFDWLKAYGTVGVNTLEKIDSQYMRYGLGVDLIPAGSGFAINIEGNIKNVIKTNSTSFRMAVGIGVEF